MSSSDNGTVDRLDATIPGAFPDGNVSQTAITTQQTLSQALYERRAEYTRPRNVRIKIGSWNVAAQKGTEKDIGAWFVQGKGVEEGLGGLGIASPVAENAQHRESVAEQEARVSKKSSTVPRHDAGAIPEGEEIGLYVLGLQEIVDISSPAEALRPYTDPSVANRWKQEIMEALPQGYELVTEQQLIGLLLLVYASPAISPHVKNVSTTSVGTGLMGYMGNKGAVTARIVLGETTRLVFINSHLAAGADKAALDRRNWDAAQITSRTRFDPITDFVGNTQAHGESLGDEDFAFWFGDLNYRLEGMPGDDVRHLLTIHTQSLDPAEADHVRDPSISSDPSDKTKLPSSSASAGDDAVPLPPELDPASLQTTITSLLPHDELHQQRRNGKAFHDGWDEGPIRFLPTYKYDVGKVGVFDSSEKRRCPSWCDRIIFRTRTAKESYDVRKREREEAKKRDEEMKAKGMDHAGDDEQVLYDYDPETDGDNGGDYDDYDEAANLEPEDVITKDGFSDELLLEYYTCHMRVLSSDHKPLDAVFGLKYDAVIPDLKAAVHQEIARELDRQENEGRPSITVVVDHSPATISPENEDSTDTAFDGVDFGDIQYAKSKRRNITIANTGRVPASFGFVDRPAEEDQGQGPFPPWLTVTFDREPDKSGKHSSGDYHSQYTLEPAEVMNGELKVKVEAMSAVRGLNEGTSSLDDILVLRVQDGRDHFLPLRGHWQLSILARSIDKLIRIPEGGIRKLQHQKPDCEQKVRSAPRELFRLTEAIEDLTERAVADWNMISHEGNKAPWQHNAGWPFVKDPVYFANGAHEDTMAHIYEALDCDQSFTEAFDADTSHMQELELLAEVLLQFLRSLQDGVVTEEVWSKVEDDMAARERSKQHLSLDDEKIWILETLASTPDHNAPFLLIMTMLQRLSNEITMASRPDPKTPRSSTDLPASPQVSVRRRTLSKIPEVAVRQLINRNYATVFSEAMFRSKDLDKLKDKEKLVRKERMIRVIEVFLDNGEGAKK